MMRTRADKRSQQILAARTAAALDQPFTVRVVVVRELLAFANRLGGPNPDDAVLDVHVTVGLAGVVDEARDVPADPGIDYGPIGQLEAPDMAAFDVAALPPQALLVRDLLAGVVGDP